MQSQVEVFDVLVVGGGPAGVAAAAEFHRRGFRCILLDRGTVGEGIAKWPHLMKFFSTAEKVELPGLALITLQEKPSREEYLQYLRRYVRECVSEFRPFHEVESIQRLSDGTSSEAGARFRVSGVDRWSQPWVLLTRTVVLATGAFDEPNALNIPGEDLPHVSHYFSEVHKYALHRVVIVGGSSSAVETALLLWRHGSQVTIVHRGPEFRTLKFWLSPDIQNRIRAGEIQVHFSSRLRRIEPDQVEIETPGGPIVQSADYVLALTGYRPSTTLLQSVGADFDPVTRRPTVDPKTLESSVPGFFVAGVMLAGDMAGEIFIENSRDHGAQIAPALQKRIARIPD